MLLSPSSAPVVSRLKTVLNRRDLFSSFSLLIWAGRGEGNTAADALIQLAYVHFVGSVFGDSVVLK